MGKAAQGKDVHMHKEAYFLAAANWLPRRVLPTLYSKSLRGKLNVVELDKNSAI